MSDTEAKLRTKLKEAEESAAIYKESMQLYIRRYRQARDRMRRLAAEVERLTRMWSVERERALTAEQKMCAGRGDLNDRTLKRVVESVLERWPVERWPAKWRIKKSGV